MTHSICFRAVVAVAAVLMLLGSAVAARADDRTSIEAGRAAARTVLLFSDPRMCGVAILRVRCVADVELYLRGRGEAEFSRVPKIGPHPAAGLRAFVANGDRDAFDLALRWINNVQATAPQWSSDPRDAALYDAGIDDVFLAAAGPNQMAQALMAAPAADLAVHVAQIPAGTLPLDVAPLRQLNMTTPNALRVLPFARDLAAAVRVAYPPAPIFVLAPPESPAADAQLGLASQAAGELTNAPRWLAQAEVQQLVAAVADRYDLLLGAGASADLRAGTRVDASYNRDAALKAGHALAERLGQRLPTARFQCFVLGLSVAQIAFGSAITRDAGSQRVLLDATASSPALDQALPGWAAARAAGSSIGADDWLAQHAYAMRLVDIIKSAGQP